MRVYELSAQDRIIGVSQNWDQVAKASGGEMAVAHNVLGRPIWDFIVGLDTRSYMNALLFAARSGRRAVSVKYRCDLRAQWRLYQLQIEPLEDKGLRLVHQPLEDLPRPAPASFAPEGALRCCSQCLRCRWGAGWEEVDVQPFLSRRALDFVICPSCRAEAQKAIQQALGARVQDEIPAIAGQRPC